MRELQELGEQAQEFLEASKASNTKRAYRADWADFSAWCETHGRQALPASPETVGLYLTAQAAKVKPATIQRRLSTISQAHQAAGYDTPTKTHQVRTLWAGIRRKLGTAQEGAAAAGIEELRRMVATLDESLAGVRDRALLLLGFAGAFRRSELVSLDVGHVRRDRNGLVVHLARSKTDQDGQGTDKGIPYGSVLETCPVRSLEYWLECAGLQEGPLWRSVDRHGNLGTGRLSAYAVALIVKRAAKAAGLDPEQFSGHSLRVGFVTTADERGVPEAQIMDQTGHTAQKMLRKYRRRSSLFRNNAAAQVGL